MYVFNIVYHFLGVFLVIIIVPVNYTISAFPFSHYMVNYFHVSGYGLLWLIVPKYYIHVNTSVKNGEGPIRSTLFCFVSV